jgi:hypothetical protein
MQIEEGVNRLGGRPLAVSTPAPTRQRPSDNQQPSGTTVSNNRPHQPDVPETWIFEPTPIHPEPRTNKPEQTNPEQQTQTNESGPTKLNPNQQTRSHKPEPEPTILDPRTQTHTNGPTNPDS